MSTDIKEHDEHATPHGLSSAESAVHERLVMLACPFCGGNTVLEHEFTTSRYRSDYKDNYTVRCGTPRCFGRTSTWKAYHEKGEAISRWNTRAT